jgi:hypothetical protein
MQPLGLCIAGVAIWRGVMLLWIEQFKLPIK